MAAIKSTFIELKSGMLLSKEILEQMNFQSRLFQVQYDSYPDGIIYGFELSEENEILWLSSGLIKWHGKYFFSTEKINVFKILDEFDTECTSDFTEHCILAFVPDGQEIINEGIVYDRLVLKLYNRKMLNFNDMVIAEFQYHYKKRKWDSAQISAYERLEDQLNPKGYSYTFLNVRYSMPDENVFSPCIYRMMKECLKEKKNLSDADRILLFTLYQDKLISFEVLREWFELHGLYTDMSDRKSVISDFLHCMLSEKSHADIALSVRVSEKKMIPKKQFGY